MTTRAPRRAGPRLVCALALAALAAPSPVRAERLTSRPMPSSGVTGLELSLEGATSGPRGGSLRWMVTLYEVVGHDELRPARGGRLRLLASHSPETALADLRTDHLGRAELDLPIPANLHGGFQAVIQARVGEVTREFTIDLQTTAPGRVDLVADRDRIQPGERVAVVGRAVDLLAGGPVADRTTSVRLADQDGRALADLELRTSPTGVFVASFVAPERVTALRVEARVEEVGRAAVSVSVGRPDVPRMVVRAAPSARVVSPGEVVGLEVMVRRADGRPVVGAELGVEPASGRLLTPAPIRTGEAGRARVAWRAPAVPGRSEDLVVGVTARRAGLGTARTEAPIRVAGRPFEAVVSVEGGDLLPDLPSRVFVRVSLPSGEPAAGVPVSMEGPMVGAHDGRTDRSGTVVFETTPRAPAGLEGRDRCGGATAASVEIAIGEGGRTVRLERCLTVDPEGTVRPRPAGPVAEAGGALELELEVAARAAAAPIELVLLESRGDRLVPLGRTVLRPGLRRASLDLPARVVGLLHVRARPLVGRDLTPVRGGVATFWASPGPALDLTLSEQAGGALVVAGRPLAGSDSTVLVVPAAEAEAAGARLASALLGDEPPAGVSASPSSLAAWLAASSGRDEAAPAVLRGREVVVVPAPESPESLGVLRDPVRARARFVRGRLALVVGSLERQLSETLPEGVDDFGVERGGRWSWNREALEAVVGAQLLREVVPTTLGGRRLGLEDVERLDRAFTFDNLARRITRERMLSLLVSLRSFVRDRQLDIGRPLADPAPWLDLLVSDGIVEEGALHDGWGRRMAIRRAPAGRARFGFLAPLPAGHELVSAGPDGRFGTGDDLYDPFGRVLPSGSPYAEAVGEDELLARLERVELGQATIAELTQLFEVSSGLESGGGEPAPDGPGELPAVVVRGEPAESFERAWTVVERAAPSLAPLEGRRTLALEVGDEPRGFAVVALGFTPAGRVETESRELRAGYPVIVAAPSVGRLRPGEPLELPVVVTRLPGGPERLALVAEGSGAVRAEVASGSEGAGLELGPGGATLARVRLVAERQGAGSVRLRVSSPERAGSRRLELPVAAIGDGLLRLQAAAAAATDGTELRVELPDDAVEPRGVLVVSGPTSFLADPALEAWAERDPALLAWALAVTGQELPEPLRRRLEAATSRDGSVVGEAPALSTACAAVAFAAETSGVDWAERATASRAAGPAEPGSLAGPLELDAAVLAALSVAASPEAASPLSRSIAARRDAVRGAVRFHRDRPAVMALGAAALLLGDRRDVRGRTMLSLAREHLAPGLRGGLVVSEGTEAEGEPPGRRSAEQLAATAALAIAAHQSGDRELAAELARGLAARAHVAAELGGEALFWYLAARAFGVFGLAEQVVVTLDQGDGPRRVEVGPRAVVLPLALPRPGGQAFVRVEATEGSAAVPLVQTLVRYVRPALRQREGPLAVELSGEPGVVGGRAAFVVTVSNAGDERVDRPVLLVSMPAGARFDEVAQQAVRRTPGVADLRPEDRRGVLRVELGPLEGASSIRVPLPLLWAAGGERSGPAVAAFRADRSFELTVLPRPELEVAFRPTP